MAETSPDSLENESQGSPGARGRLQGLLWPVGVALVLTLVATVLWSADVFLGLDRLAYDGMFDLRRRVHPGRQVRWQEQAAEEIVIVEYDDVSKSLLKIKGIPPRRYFSRLLATTAGASKAVLFDYYFPRQGYPDSRTQEIDRNLHYNLEKLLGKLRRLPLEAADADPMGLDRFSEKTFLEEMGIFGDPGPEALAGLDTKRWEAFLEEIRLRQAETVERIRSNEESIDGVLRKLDPAVVYLLEKPDDQDEEAFTKRLRLLSATVINTLFLEDIQLGWRILQAQDVVLARFIDEGGRSVQESDPLFQSVAAAEGLINAVKDEDGRLRTVPLVRMTKTTDLEFALSLTGAVVAHDIKPGDVSIGEDARAGSFRLPEDLRLRINYIGGPHSIRYIPLYRFCHDEIDPEARKRYEADGGEVLPPVDFENPEEIEGRIVLVGDTTKDGQDFIVTPVSRFHEHQAGEVEFESTGASLEEMPGVEMHAHALFNILHDTWLRPVSVGATWLLCFALGCVCLVFYWQRIGFMLSGVLFVILVTGVFLASYAFFLEACTVFPLVPVLAVIGFNFVGGGAYQGILQQMKKQAVTSMFGKYVSDNLVRKMVSGELQVDLKGREKELTVLFSDIRGFTRLSEGLDPETVSGILHDYFTRMIREIFDHGGTLDKLMGDAIMAFFGDPEDMPDHRRKAAEASLAMLEALEEFKRTSEIPTIKDFNIGIGLNTGVVTVGNLGSDEYFDYTVIGDNVNLGSRLEGLNKAYETQVILCESTYADIASDFTCRRLGKVTVVGRSKPVEIYELLGKKGDVSEERLEAKKIFETGLDHWENGRFTEAARHFEDAVQRFEDGPSRVFLGMSREFEASPPETWDGVFVPKGK